MKNAASNRIVFYVFLLFLFSTGCRERIEVKLHSSSPRLVVDARFTNDTAAHIVRLSRTCDYFDPNVDSLAVSGATVYISDDGGMRFPFNEDPDRPGCYVSDSGVFGIMGEYYNLHIEAAVERGGETQLYEARSIMPVMPVIDSVRAVYGVGLPPFYTPDPDHPGWSLLLYAQDPPTREYIGFSYAVNGQMYGDSITNLFIFPDNFSSGLYLNGVAIFFFPDTATATESDRHIVLSEGDVLTLHGYSFTEDYNNYISQINTAISPSVPVFGGAPANAVSNISNGAFGYFAVYSTGKASCTIGRKIPFPFIGQSR